jgi:hypothetical protein
MRVVALWRFLEGGDFEDESGRAVGQEFEDSIHAGHL